VANSATAQDSKHAHVFRPVDPPPHLKTGRTAPHAAARLSFLALSWRRILLLATSWQQRRSWRVYVSAARLRRLFARPLGKAKRKSA
jgi:hypothetical protein